MPAYIPKAHSFLFLGLSILIVCAAIASVVFTPATLAKRTSNQAVPTTASLKFNGRIAFTSTRDALAFNIYSMNPDGSNPIRLTDDVGHGHNPSGPTYDFDQAWSPDGTKIAFTSNREGDSWEIFTMNADGTNVQRLTNNLVSDGQPAWSPDGTRIAFTRGGGCVILTKAALATATDDPCIPTLYVMNADGSNPVKLSEPAGGDMGPVWSPDGSRIAFTVFTSSLPDSEIYVMNADGSQRTRLTNNSSADYVSSWSPDGTKLAFASNRDSAPNVPYFYQLYTMNVDGSNQLRLTNNQTDDQAPVFSPDGTKIAFQRGQSSPVNPADNTEIFVMNADGSNQVNITNNQADDFGPPSWQPLSAPPENPPPAVLQFSSSDYSVNEAESSTQITVVRSGNTSEATSVQYETRNGSASDISDYTSAFGTLHFAAGETTQSFAVLVTDDAFVENTETILISLHDLSGNAILGVPGEAQISIVDNDTSGQSNPIDDTRFFVRQHYHDFLNREPDTAGFAFWVDNIESCGADAACREVKRIDTSAAFFLSIEFQQTGFYVYRLYVGSLSIPPNYLQFIHDTQQIGDGLVVGAPGWEQKMDANIQAFTEAFVSRTIFRYIYPEGLPASSYVDRLYAHEGLTPSPAERTQAIAAYGVGDTAGRARALRIVANNATFSQRTFNQAFVSAEYFGYLRRDPDYPGYGFWLNKLQQFNGDFRQAEMVKAFLNSSEYRHRFGP